MKLYEVKFLCPESLDAEDVQTICSSASSRTKSVTIPVGVSIHARPPEEPVNRGYEATVMLAVHERDSCWEFAGVVARISGLPVANIMPIAGGTLNFKSDVTAIEDFAQAVSEQFSIHVSDDQDGDGGFATIGRDEADASNEDFAVEGDDDE